MSFASGFIPYCGLPPTPADLWQRWNLDPFLIAALLAGLGAYVLARVTSHRVKWDRELVFAVSGWAVLTVALLSPLCALSVALFSARVGQHVIITMLAAPILVCARPLKDVVAFVPGTLRQVIAGRDLGFGVLGATLFAVFVWMWHTPFFYGLTFRSNGAYWAMHLSLFGSAYLLWRFLLVGASEQPLVGLAMGFLTVIQMSMLGAILSFAARPLFADHLITTFAWSMSPLSDQQLGGLIMWVPACATLIAAGTMMLARALRKLDQDFVAGPSSSVHDLQRAG